MRAGGGRRAGARDPRSHRQGIARVPEPPRERGGERSAHQPTPRRAVSGGLSDLAVPANERLDRGVAGAPEPISGPRASNRRGRSASIERGRSRRRGRNGRRVEGERPPESTGDRDGPLDLQRHGVNRSQAPRGGPLQQRTDSVRQSVPCRPEILRLLFDALGRSRRLVRVVLNEANRPDLAELGSLLGRNMRVQFHFPSRPLSTTRLAHTYVFPSDQEVFILNSFYREGELAADKLQGLWVGDMDFVRIQLEAMLLDLSQPTARERKAFPKAR